MPGQPLSQSATTPSASLPSAQLETLQAAVAGLDALQLQWVSGYAAGLAAAHSQPVVAADPGNALTILYGSQTGNGESVATALAESVRSEGFSVNLHSLADYKPSSLKREALVSLIVSTHGEGDPPDDAELFHEFLLSEKAPNLAGLKYSVLALGDSSYIDFCETGRDFDRRLADLGAERLAPVLECDLDYESAATNWADDIVARLPELLRAGASVPQLKAVKNVASFDKKNPFSAEVLVNQKITGGGSDKDVRHIELSLEGSGLDYEPGDALAVLIENPPRLVNEILSVQGLDPDELVLVQGESLRVVEALTRKLEVTRLNLGFLRRWAEIAAAPELRALLGEESPSALAAMVESQQIVDVLRQYPGISDAQTFCDSLRTLGPRSYSIASSQNANPDEVHLTVAAVRYDAFGTEHWGAGSTYLVDRLVEGNSVPVFVEKNSRFRLPANNDVPIIMIGPGTGIAPFRAFVEERADRNASGANWLFFGGRTFADDFLYQLEWQRHLKRGHLARLDVAFSRDQREKIYVQDRLREHAGEVYSWLQNGAYLFVCGDAKSMASDVHDALVDIWSQEGDVDRQTADRALKELRRAGRYQRDVY
jgi:sulfite reductase (NADPH) flavoprotein alpha-component